MRPRKRRLRNCTKVKKNSNRTVWQRFQVMLKISYGDITAIALSRERTGNTVETCSNKGP